MIFLYIVLFGLSMAVYAQESEPYLKIARDGSEMTESNLLNANESKQWACTKDQRTGLIWEVKSDDGSLHDKRWYYSWYEPDKHKNGDFEGYKHYYPQGCIGSECDTDSYRQSVNLEHLCDCHQWRLPTLDELKSLKNDLAVANQHFFPNIQSHWYWTSSIYAYDRYRAWRVDFKNQDYGTQFKDVNGAVMLVCNKS
jgi:hypothetical protein